MQSKLSSDYIVGFTDGEGSFCVFVRKPAKPTWNTRVECHYYVKLREDDLNILKKIKSFFGCGIISYQKEYRLNQRDNYRYEISNLPDINRVVIPFFKKHPLRSKRKKDFELFCKIVGLMNNKRHQTKKGLMKIKNLKKQMHK